MCEDTLSEAWSELTGETDRENAAREQARQFARDQQVAALERKQAAENAAREKRDELAARAERGGLGRASTLLTGPRGLTDGISRSRRMLLPG